MKTNMKLRKMIVIAMFMALSVVGAYIKIPSPVGTVAFDSMPAFVLAGLFGPLVGGLAGMAAHLMDAILSGFPLGLPLHLIIGLMMFLTVGAFGIVYRKFNKMLAVVAATIMNGPFCLFVLYFILGWGFVVSMFLPLVVGGLANALLAVIVIEALSYGLGKNESYLMLTGKI